MRTAVLSFVYPGVERYLPQFIRSLSNQNDKDFVLFLINDQVDNLRTFLEDFDLPVKIQNSFGSPAKLRKTGIAWVADEKFDIVVFADADDCFSENRVLLSKGLLRNNDIIFNELLLFGKNMSKCIPMLEPRFVHGQYIGESSLLNANCLGMSNTAVRINKITDLASGIPDTVIAFDWALYVKLLNAGSRALFTKETSTYYRQHVRNIASPLAMTDEQILRGVNVKAEHYSALKNLNKWYFLQSGTFTWLLKKLYADDLFRHKYCETVRSHLPANPLWWEPIKSAEELKL
jgi:glycosyltransferase involved in cell wall biosynthesis